MKKIEALLLLALLLTSAGLAVGATVTRGSDLSANDPGSAQLDSDYQIRHSHERDVTVCPPVIPDGGTCYQYRGGDTVYLSNEDNGLTGTTNHLVKKTSTGWGDSTVVDDGSGHVGSGGAQVSGVGLSVYLPSDGDAGLQIMQPSNPGYIARLRAGVWGSQIEAYYTPTSTYLPMFLSGSVASLLANSAYGQSKFQVFGPNSAGESVAKFFTATGSSDQLTFCADCASGSSIWHVGNLQLESQSGFVVLKSGSALFKPPATNGSAGQYLRNTDGTGATYWGPQDPRKVICPTGMICGGKTDTTTSTSTATGTGTFYATDTQPVSSTVSSTDTRTNVMLGTGTTNVLPKRKADGTYGDSSVSDDGTSVSTTEAVAMGQVVAVAGTLSPNAAGKYLQSGTYGGQTKYTGGGAGWSIWYNGSTYWYITASAGSTAAGWYYAAAPGPLPVSVTWTTGAGVTGSATSGALAGCSASAAGVLSCQGFVGSGPDAPVAPLMAEVPAGFTYRNLGAAQVQAGTAPALIQENGALGSADSSAITTYSNQMQFWKRCSSGNYTGTDLKGYIDCSGNLAFTGAVSGSNLTAAGHASQDCKSDGTNCPSAATLGAAPAISATANVLAQIGSDGASVTGSTIVSASGDYIPLTDAVTSLGSSTHRFKTGYFSNQVNVGSGFLDSTGHASDDLAKNGVNGSGNTVSVADGQVTSVSITNYCKADGSNCPATVLGDCHSDGTNCPSLTTLGALNPEGGVGDATDQQAQLGNWVTLFSYNSSFAASRYVTLHASVPLRANTGSAFECSVQFFVSSISCADAGTAKGAPGKATMLPNGGSNYYTTASTVAVANIPSGSQWICLKAYSTASTGCTVEANTASAVVDIH